MSSNVTRTAPPVLTVSELNVSAARILENSFPLTWVSGEISNFMRAASGHWYFTLKDTHSQVRAVMFKGRAQYTSFTPREGDKIEVCAQITLYTARGEFQLNIESIRRAGVGTLFDAFLKLKEKLNTEGLFDPSKKQAIPPFAQCIGIITSTHAAALRDVLTSLARRAPHVKLILYPTPVQGESAGKQIAHTIDTAHKRAECDVLILCRGGGSIEDLWAFNEEVVARAIARCTIPIISGVGHETDFTIADFVADLRAATPTAAAEQATTPRDVLINTVFAHSNQLIRTIMHTLSQHTQSLDWLSRRLVNPQTHIKRQRQQLEALHQRLHYAIGTPITHARFNLKDIQTRLTHLQPNNLHARTTLTEQLRRLNFSMTTSLAKHGQKIKALSEQLNLLDPQNILQRGYAIVTDANNNIIRDPNNLQAQQKIIVQAAKGRAKITISDITKDVNI